MTCSGATRTFARPPALSFKGVAMTELRRAVAALERGPYAQALAALLEVWRGSRAVQLADVIDVVSRRSREGQPGIEAKTAKARANQWNALFSRAATTNFELLVEGLANEKIDEASRRVEALSALAPDPRLSRALLELLAALPYSSNSSLKFWTQVSEVLASCADARALNAATWLSKRHEALVARPRSDTILAKLRKVDQAIAKHSVRSLLPEEVALLERLGPHQTSDTASGDALLKQIYETPEDDAPRQVYADWLQDRGDVRGEFIALQLARAKERELVGLKEKRLLGTWQKSWLGPLGRGRILDVRSVTFARGFFSSGRLHLHHVDVVEGHREWATCEALDFGGFWSAKSVLTFVRQPVMRGLRVLRNVAVGVLWDLARKPLRLPLEEVQVVSLSAKGLGRLLRGEVRSLRSVHLIEAEVATALGLVLEKRCDFEQFSVQVPGRHGAVLSGPKGARQLDLTISSGHAQAVAEFASVLRAGAQDVAAVQIHGVFAPTVRKRLEKTLRQVRVPVTWE